VRLLAAPEPRERTLRGSGRSGAEGGQLMRVVTSHMRHTVGRIVPQRRRQWRSGVQVPGTTRLAAQYRWQDLLVSKRIWECLHEARVAVP
jgi:hypothetical protein